MTSPAVSASPALVDVQLRSIRQVAERLGISVRHVWRLVHNGKLPTVKISQRCIRITQWDVDAYVAKLVQASV